MLKNLSKEVLTIFGGETGNVSLDNSVGCMGELSPHSHKVPQSAFNSLWCIFDIGVPHIVCSLPGHFQVIIFLHVNCHQCLVIVVIFGVVFGMEHMAFQHIEQLAQ